MGLNERRSGLQERLRQERIRNSVRTYKDGLKFWRSGELEGRYWGMENTPLVKGESDLWGYNKTFSPLFNEQEGNIKEYIEDSFASKWGSVKVLDIGSIGSAVMRGFSEGFVEKSAAVSLTDFRKYIDSSLAESDDLQNHTVIEGDMLSRRTQKEVQDYFGGEIDVILSHMMAGRDSVSDDSEYVVQRAKGWYGMLSENGLITAQLPGSLKRYMSPWKKMIDQKYPESLEVRLAADNSLVRIHKRAYAPSELPLL